MRDDQKLGALHHAGATNSAGQISMEVCGTAPFCVACLPTTADSEGKLLVACHFILFLDKCHKQQVAMGQWVMYWYKAWPAMPNLNSCN